MGLNQRKDDYHAYIHIHPYPIHYPFNDVYLNHGKDDESIAGDGGDAEGVEDQRQPESREAGRQLCFHRLSSNVLFTRFLLSCTDLLHVLA